MDCHWLPGLGKADGLRSFSLSLLLQDRYYASSGTQATMTYFITIAGRRWPARRKNTLRAELAKLPRGTCRVPLRAASKAHASNPIVVTMAFSTDDGCWTA